MKPIRLVIPMLVSAALSACTVGPDYHAPQTAMPGAFAATQPAATQPTTAQAAAPVDIALWWRSLGDAELDSLVDRAITANLDLEIALTRLQEARTIEIVTEDGALPVGAVSGGAARGSGTNSVKGRIDGPLNAGTNTTGLKEITQVVGFDAGWELDLFGRYRRELEAARADTGAAMEMRNDVLITVVADVARAYIDTLALQSRLDILLDNQRIAQQTLDIVQQRFDRGIINELDVALAKRQLAALSAQIAPMNAEIIAGRLRIAVLLGEYSGALDVELSKPAKLPEIAGPVAAGLPLDLLRRRPDIRQSERAVAAATARIGVAVADLYPRLAVTAGVGMQGQGLGRSNPTNSFLWSAGPTAEWPVLDFGALDSTISIRELSSHEALVNYKETVLAAVEEVNDAIARFSAEQSRLEDLNAALDASQRAVTLAQDRYDRGLTDFLNVADAERELYELQDQYATAQEAVVIQYIALYKGLGGGWENFQHLPPIRKTQPAILATMERGSGSDAGK